MPPGFAGFYSTDITMVYTIELGYFTDRFSVSLLEFSASYLAVRKVVVFEVLNPSFCLFARFHDYSLGCWLSLL